MDRFWDTAQNNQYGDAARSNQSRRFTITVLVAQSATTIPLILFASQRGKFSGMTEGMFCCYGLWLFAGLILLYCETSWLAKRLFRVGTLFIFLWFIFPLIIRYDEIAGSPVTMPLLIDLSIASFCVEWNLADWIPANWIEWNRSLSNQASAASSSVLPFTNQDLKRRK